MLTPDDLQQLAALSCLSLSEQDCIQFASSINQLLPLVEQMQNMPNSKEASPIFNTPLRSDTTLQDQNAASFRLQWDSILATANKGDIL